MTLEEIELRDLIEMLEQYQKRIFNLTSKWIEFSFDWEEATTELVEIKRSNELYKWLYPIKFSSTLAFILEILINDFNYIDTDREKAFELICLKFRINLDSFYKGIEDIQNILIAFGKVKICKSGKVIIMKEM